VLCDTGERYLSKLYDDAWMRENQMLETEHVTVEFLLAQRPAQIPPLVSVAPSASIRQALNLMSTYGISQVPVIAGNDCVGSVTEGPVIARALADAQLLERSVAEVMQPPFPVVDATLPFERLNTLLSHETQAALVRKEGLLIGLVTRYDVLRQVSGIR
jgi:cystathionine beta-synthase